MKRKEAYMDDLRPIVYLVGIGMGGEDQLTGRAMDCLEAAQVVMGRTGCWTASARTPIRNGYFQSISQ